MESEREAEVDADGAREYAPVLEEPLGDHGVLLRLNRPERLNALDARTVRELLEALRAAEPRGVRSIVITGTGRAFCAGFDLKQQLTPAEIDQQLTGQQELTAVIRELPIPVIAAVNGPAIGGGCELSLACDILLAAPDAVLGLPEVRLGTAMGGGSSFLLPRQVGWHRALEFVLVGEPVAAAAAHDMGLVSRVVDLEHLLDEAARLADLLGGRPRHAVAAAKHALNRGSDGTLRDALAAELDDIRAANGTAEAEANVEHFRRHSTYVGEAVDRRTTW